MVIQKLKAVRDFFGEVQVELRKSTWPTRSELIESTTVVILSVVFFALFVGISDTLLAALVRLLGRN